MNNLDLVKTLIKPIFKICAVLMIVIIFSYIFYYYFRSKTNWNIACNKECDKEDVSLTDMFYFCTVTGFTVGYGDISPKNEILKYLVMLKIILTSGIVIY
jgi:hypothetical protein